MIDLDDLTRTVRTKAEKCGCGCWVWNGTVDRYGYAGVKMHGKRVLVHRYVYETAYEERLGEMTVDHLCDRHRNCINPAHMEPVTRSVNSTRANQRRWHDGEPDRSLCTIRPSNETDSAATDRPEHPQQQGDPS